MSEVVVSSEVRYQGRVLNLRLDEVRLPGGGTLVREVIEHAQAVSIIPVDEQGQVYLVRQHRVGSGGPLLEIPAGTVEEAEEPLACARREIQEEVGRAAGRWDALGSFYLAPGYSTEFMHFYLARDLRESRREADFDEDIQVEVADLGQALHRVLGGEPSDVKTVAGLMLAWARLRN